MVPKIVFGNNKRLCSVWCPSRAYIYQLVPCDTAKASRTDITSKLSVGYPLRRLRPLEQIFHRNYPLGTLWGDRGLKNRYSTKAIGWVPCEATPDTEVSRTDITLKLSFGYPVRRQRPQEQIFHQSDWLGTLWGDTRHRGLTNRYYTETILWIGRPIITHFISFVTRKTTTPLVYDVSLRAFSPIPISFLYFGRFYFCGEVNKLKTFSAENSKAK